MERWWFWLGRWPRFCCLHIFAYIAFLLTHKCIEGCSLLPQSHCCFETIGGFCVCDVIMTFGSRNRFYWCHNGGKIDGPVAAVKRIIFVLLCQVKEGRTGLRALIVGKRLWLQYTWYMAGFIAHSNDVIWILQKGSLFLYTIYMYVELLNILLLNSLLSER